MIIEKCSNLEETKLVIQHFFDYCLEQGFIAAKALTDQKVWLINNDEYLLWEKSWIMTGFFDGNN